MQPILVAIVVLLAVLIGAAVPTLIQLRSTLRSAQQVLDRTGPRIERAIEEVTEAADRLNRMAIEFENGAKKVKPLIDTVADLGDQAVRLKDSLRTAAAIGSALGPALAAAMRAFVAQPDGKSEDAASPGKEDHP